MGIGINTATVIVGNIGSARRARFGVLGSGRQRREPDRVVRRGRAGARVAVARRPLPGSLRIDGRHEVVPKGRGRPITVYEIGGIVGDRPVRDRAADQPFRSPPCRLRLRYRIVAGSTSASGRTTRPSSACRRRHGARDGRARSASSTRCSCTSCT
jgi:adenylate cyclase